tara:strand:+ start:394 stop:1428 length:1035 start_codon:yes stop_codon:yes gene_type:complete
MNLIIVSILISLIIIFGLNFFLIKSNKFIYNPLEEHKESFNEKILISGGLSIFLFLLVFNFFNHKTIIINYISLLTIVIFFLGLFSDLKKIGPALRLFFLLLITLFYVSSNNLYIYDLQFSIINNFFDKNLIAAIIFSSLCIVILVNGINFVDGVHGLAILYVIITILLLNYFVYQVNVEFINFEDSLYLIPTLIILYFLNINEKVFLGDSGSYLLAAALGFSAIKISNLENLSYPYVYANLLIYPAFEVLFSIVRKSINKKNPLNPDRKHLHHLIQNYFTRKKFSLKNSKIFTGIVINSFILFHGLNTIILKDLKFVLILNVFFFCLIYLFFYNFFLKRNLNY